MLRDNRIIPEIAQQVRAAEFYVFGHQKLFEGIVALANAGNNANVVTLDDWLKANQALDDAGGHAYLVDLWDAAPGSASNARSYVDIVRRHAQNRALIHLGNELARSAGQPDADPTALREQAGKSIFELSAGTEVTAVGYRFAPVTLEELAARAMPPEWAIRRIMVRGQPVILGGPRKSLKTSILVDLTISLATGTPFLGTFAVPRACRVCMVSGESGDWNILDTARRVCQAKGVSFANAGVNGLFGFRLPQLGKITDLMELRRGLGERKVLVVILDPLYLCLLAGVDPDGPQASNLFTMGPIYQQVARICLEAGATPILAHHFRMTRADHTAQPDLGDLAYAGVQEYARQWVLVGRRESFTAGAPHRLWLVAGGAIGHAGCWGVDIDEGELADDFSGREWNVQVITEAEAIAEAGGRKVDKCQQRRARKERADDTALLDMLDTLDHDRQGATRNKLRRRLGWGDERTAKTIERLVDEGILEILAGTVIAGRGAQRDGQVVRRRPLEDHASVFDHAPGDDPGA